MNDLILLKQKLQKIFNNLYKNEDEMTYVDDVSESAIEDFFDLIKDVEYDIAHLNALLLNIYNSYENSDLCDSYENLEKTKLEIQVKSKPKIEKKIEENKADNSNNNNNITHYIEI